MNALIRTAERHLRSQDPVLARIITANGPCTLGRKRQDPFHILTTSIISQQLSTKAADTIAGRVAQQVGANGARQTVFRPAHFLDVPHEALRGCGLSNAKARWIVDIARRTHSGEFSFRKLVRLDDEAAIDMLDALPGIGRWSAEMYLIFALHRLDIFAMDDVGLRRGVDRLYGKGRKLSERRTQQITKLWAPYRSVASWHLWRMQDNEPGGWD